MFIERNVSPEKSIVLRYGKNIQTIPYRYLAEASISEGARVVACEAYKGVAISILDLSSLSITKTFKDNLAVITIADCLHRGITRIVFQSSGNTGNALSVYAHKHGIETIFLHQKSSNYKINPEIQHPLGISIACDVSEPELKTLATAAAEYFDAELLPTFQHQIEANKLRAYFLSEYFVQTREHFDWHVQALSSAYGVFGYYQGLEDLAASAHPGIQPHSPKLLGVQQEAVSPYADHFSNSPTKKKSDAASIIEPTLFRTEPTEKLYQRMAHILDTYGGHITVVTNDEYVQRFATARAMLEKAGIEFGLTSVEGKEILVEQAGVMALVGCLQAIDRGQIREGNSALVVFTGGAKRSVQKKINYTPSYTLSSNDADAALRAIAREKGLSVHTHTVQSTSRV